MMNSSPAVNLAQLMMVYLFWRLSEVLIQLGCFEAEVGTLCCWTMIGLLIILLFCPFPFTKSGGRNSGKGK